MKGTEIAEQTVREMRQDRRAWLAIESPTLIRFQVDQVPTFDLVIENVGKTPASIEKVRFVSSVAGPEVLIGDRIDCHDEGAFTSDDCSVLRQGQSSSVILKAQTQLPSRCAKELSMET